MRIDPWGSSQYQDYARLRDEFGIEPFTEDHLEGFPDPPALLRRGVVFGHRGFGLVRDAVRGGDPWGVMTGLMPSGRMHFGHKMVIDQVIYYQQKCGADVHIGIADFEAYATRGLSIEKARKLAIEEYVKTYLALGLTPDKGEIYFQTTRSRVKDLAYEAGLKVNLSEMRAIYGFDDSTSLAHINAPLIQAGDILHIQREEFGGPRPTLVPVGVDQDPHIRLTRGIAQSLRLYSVKKTEDGRHGVFLKTGDAWKDKEKALLDAAEATLKKLGFADLERNDPYRAIYVKGASSRDLTQIDLALAKTEPRRGGHGFVPPSSSYHRFLTGLDGGKMSSSRENSAIFLSDDLEDAKKKIGRAKTGGRQSAEEQRRLGADPDACSIYEMYLYHLMDSDQELLEYYKGCKSGELLCGQCKGRAKDLIEVKLGGLQERKAAVTDAEIKEVLSED
ncbi:MAG: tryptophan--tRNA ligase [Euryarchaeota archaeon]|nr:tryptophan--tRNA ligase [Euryarchaeota archaeon]